MSRISSFGAFVHTTANTAEGASGEEGGHDMTTNMQSSAEGTFHIQGTPLPGTAAPLAGGVLCSRLARPLSPLRRAAACRPAGAEDAPNRGAAFLLLDGKPEGHQTPGAPPPPLGARSGCA